MKISQLIKELQDDPDEILNSLDEKNLKKIIDYLNDNYYNNNKSLISDQLYDYVKEFYELNFNKKISVGAEIKSINRKVKLPYYMGSLDKIKPSSGVFDKWINQYSGPYVISFKLDGISALLYKNDDKVYMYTRGNGIEGQDISHCIEIMGINISKLKNGDAIRGELIMSKDNFKKISDTMANARNAVSGIINTKNPDPKMLKLIDFVAYWVLYPELTASNQLKYIEQKNLSPKSVEYYIKKDITINELSEQLISGRKNHKYEIDGIVVIDNSKYYPQDIGSNPSWGFAFKQILTDQIAESTVVDVLWEISKDKYIKPKIKINTIELLGSEITYATAFNAKYIVDNVIGPGAIVKIIKSGDVIPYIQEIIKPADNNKPKMPSIKYEWNETKVDIIAIDLDDENMNKIIIKKLTYFFSTLNIKFMAEGTVQKFVENGYDDLPKILKADKEKLYSIEGLGEKSIDKIYDSINDGLTNRYIYEIMGASQIFGRGIGIKKFKSIIDDYPDIIDIYKKNGKDYTIKLINSINGFESKTTNKVVDNFDEFIIYLNNLIKIKPNLLIKKNVTNTFNNMLKKFSNKVIVFTGFRDKDIEKELENLGSKITSSISKNTDLVIAVDINENSNKIIKAKELNITIISKDDLDEFIICLNNLIKNEPNLLIKKNVINTLNNRFKEFSNKVIVFTGFRDKDIEKELENVGSKITSSISKNTDLVIAADPNENSNKIIKARELNITIISKDEFYNKIK
jgi:NAD-dependent DNA ligase